MAKILVVDDEPVTNRLLSLMLQRINHSVITANNGIEALSYLDKTHIDRMITDINMPDMNGLTLLEELRADQRHKNMPVIVLTAIGQEHMSQLAVQKGATNFLTRPISSWELKEAVTHCLQTA